MAHLKVIAHIYVFLCINFTFRKCDIALKTTLLVPLLEQKSSEIQNRNYLNSYVPDPLARGAQEPLSYAPPPSPLSKFHKSSAHQ